MKNELEWYDRKFKPWPRLHVRQYIMHTTRANWRMLQPWELDGLEIKGFQKRTFLHE